MIQSIQYEHSMKIQTPLFLALVFGLFLTLKAQPPEILHFGGTSFTSSNGNDSAFCKGQAVVRLVGQGFIDVPSDESYDSTTVKLGGWPCPLSTLTDTLAIIALPGGFPDDTTLSLVLTRHGQADAGPVAPTDTHVVRLEGDHVLITYTSGPWCVGSTNPIPVITAGRGSWPGVFTAQQNGSFSVIPSTGEVPLHSGAVGLQAWDYAGGHPHCPADTSFTRTIMARTVAIALYGGSAQAEWCQSDPPVSASTALPPGGHFLGDQGLHLSDDSLGTIIPALSLPRVYQLRYVPPYACTDTAAVTVAILRAPQAEIDLPGGYACEGLPAHLQAHTLDASAWAWMLDGLPTGDGTSEFTLESPSAFGGDTVSLVATSFQGCIAMDTLLVEVRKRPDVQAITAPKALPEGALPAYTAAINLDGAVLKWRFDTLASDGYQPLVSGAENAPIAGQSVTVEPLAMLPDHRTRAGDRLRLILSAASDGCMGEEDTIHTEVLPGGSPVYIPQAMTPDGNGYNDVWEIRWPAEVRPDDYRIELYNRAGGKVLDMWPLRSDFGGEGLADGVYWWVLSDRAGRRIAGDGLTIRRK
jgi:hypothetical protein